jgi:choloylglycine hydrolase
MMIKLRMSLTVFFLILCWINPLNACTDVRLTAKDGTLLVSRSMEFGIDLNSNLRSSTRGREFSPVAPSGKPGMAWKAKYGYVYLDGFNQDMAVDGMNENGLTFEFLYLPGETQYEDVPAGKENQAIPYYRVGDYILSNFKTIDEVRAAMPAIYAYAQTLPGLGTMILPAHASIFDASGKGIVIEFVKGKSMIHDSIGVMTNSPTYDWQVTNLRNYLNLTPNNPAPVSGSGTVFSVTGQGAGMVGLPGDTSPPSRFVKTAFIAKYAYQADDTAGVLNLAEHIMNNVDIPTGLARSQVNGSTFSDTTEWVIFKDITHKMIYYRTYNNMTLSSVDMNKVDFSPTAQRLQMPLVQPAYVIDNTQKFLSSKSAK